MSTLDSITTGAQVGAFLPILTAVVQRPAWSAEVKRAVAVALALVAGVVTVLVAGGWQQLQDGSQACTTILAVVAAAQATYDVIWKPTQIAPAVESITSPRSQEPAE
ncbi:hypothetical protein [Streptomyces sp. BH055]|uniref:hypothetical protein n=1 Tax=unclassified Streptomyces TaxID=2593676 RepID=UPI003BB49AFA